jgi:hypothetical protein
MWADSQRFRKGKGGALILPREAKRNAGGGPHEVRWWGPAALKEALSAEAPSTMLRMVPLPRFAGAESNTQT